METYFKGSMRFILVITLLLCTALASKKVHRPKQTSNRNNDDFTGCPYNNDFYYNGVIASPYYPSKYPNNIKCWYYMHAEQGKVLSFNFTHFDLETCCDYVTIYDGQSDLAPILVQLGGPNATSNSPRGVYHSSGRYALVTFTTDPVVAQTGFQFLYDSVFTATPCNRDILLMVNNMGSVQTVDNYQKQLDFISNNLVTKWSVGSNKVRVMINLQNDDDYATVWSSDDIPTIQDVISTVKSLKDYAPNVVGTTNTSGFEGMFRYADADMTIDPDSMGFRKDGTRKVVLMFIAQDAHANPQDFNEGMEYAHKMRASDDVKVITIAMGSGLDVKHIGKLAYGEGFYFGADYSNLASLADKVNKAICMDQRDGCGV